MHKSINQVFNNLDLMKLIYSYLNHLDLNYLYKSSKRFITIKPILNSVYLFLTKTGPKTDSYLSIKLYPPRYNSIETHYNSKELYKYIIKIIYYSWETIYILEVPFNGCKIIYRISEEISFIYRFEQNKINNTNKLCKMMVFGIYSIFE